MNARLHNLRLYEWMKVDAIGDQRKLKMNEPLSFKWPKSNVLRTNKIKWTSNRIRSMVKVKQKSMKGFECGYQMLPLRALSSAGNFKFVSISIHFGRNFLWKCSLAECRPENSQLITVKVEFEHIRICLSWPKSQFIFRLLNKFMWWKWFWFSLVNFRVCHSPFRHFHSADE